MPNNTPKEFPKNFVAMVHDYLKHNQHRYGGKYQDYFVATTPKKNIALFKHCENTPHSFQSLCCIAGKTCGLLPLTYSNDTLPVLLDAVKAAYEKCTSEDQVTIKQLFGNKSKENITEDDLLEIGLYEKVDNHPKTPGELLLRHENLKTIYAGEHQRMNRQNDSLPDHIHYWVTIQKLTPEHGEDILYQSELCTKKYRVKTAKSNDQGKIWLIIESKKELISKPANENAGQYFLSQLEKTLRAYFDDRNNAFYRAFGKKSEESIKLYSALFDKIMEGKKTSEKIASIITTLNDELAQIKKLPPEEKLKTRRLINMLTEAGFMCPDVLSSPQTVAHPLNASAQSRPIETPDAHLAPHE